MDPELRIVVNVDARLQFVAFGVGTLVRCGVGSPVRLLSQQFLSEFGKGWIVSVAKSAAVRIKRAPGNFARPVSDSVDTDVVFYVSPTLGLVENPVVFHDEEFVGWISGGHRWALVKRIVATPSNALCVRDLSSGTVQTLMDRFLVFYTVTCNRHWVIVNTPYGAMHIWNVARMDDGKQPSYSEVQVSWQISQINFLSDDSFVALDFHGDHYTAESVDLLATHSTSTLCSVFSKAVTVPSHIGSAMPQVRLCNGLPYVTSNKVTMCLTSGEKVDLPPSALHTSARYIAQRLCHTNEQQTGIGIFDDASKVLLFEVQTDQQCFVSIF